MIEPEARTEHHRQDRRPLACAAPAQRQTIPGSGGAACCTSERRGSFRDSGHVHWSEVDSMGSLDRFGAGLLHRFLGHRGKPASERVGAVRPRADYTLGTERPSRSPRQAGKSRRAISGAEQLGGGFFSATRLNGPTRGCGSNDQTDRRAWTAGE